LFVAASKMVFTKAHNQTCLAYCTIAKHYHFILEIFRFPITFRRLFDLKWLLVFLIFIFLNHYY
jgi:hypothetical protein